MNRRVRVNETLQDTVGLTVETPITAAAAPSSARAAFALADALRGGQALSERRDRDLAAQGAIDAERGTVDDSIQNRNYRNSVNRLKVRARWLEDEGEIRQSLRDLDQENLTAEELTAWIDAQYAERYDGIEDPLTAQELLPRMDRLRAQIHGQVFKVQEEAELREIGASLTTVAEAGYREAREAGTEFDYTGLNEQALAVLNGGQVNETMFTILKDIAIRNGDSRILTDAPDRWANNAPSFKSDPAFNERLLDAERRADNVAQAQAAEAARVAEAQRKEAENTVGLAAVRAAAEGDYGSAQQFSQVLSQIPGVSYQAVLALEKGIDQLDDTADQRAANEAAVGALSVGVYSGELGMSDVYAAFNLGDFGDGRQATQRMVALLSVAAANANRSGSEGNGYRAYAKNIADAYRPDRNGPFSAIDSTLQEIQGMAALEFYQLVNEQGMDPADAHSQIREKFDARATRAPTISTSKALTPIEAFQGYLQGNVSVTRMQEAGITEDMILQAQEAGVLNDDQAIEILNKLFQ